MEVYNAEFARHGLVAAQALLVPHDFVDRRQYLHARGRSSACCNWAASPSSTRTTPSPATRSATATTTASPPSCRTTWAPTSWCCSPTSRVSTPPTRAHDPSAVLIATWRPTTRCFRSPPVPGHGTRQRRDGQQAGGRPHRLVVGRAHGHRPRRASFGAGRRGRPGDRRRHHVRRTSALASGAQAVDRLRRSGHGHGRGRRRRPPGTGREAHVAASRRRRRRAGHFDEGDTVQVCGSDGVAFARGMVFVDAASLRGWPVAHPSTYPPAWPTRSSTATTSCCCPSAEPPARGSRSRGHQRRTVTP
jgi:hypothetical protein